MKAGHWQELMASPRYIPVVAVKVPLPECGVARIGDRRYVVKRAITRAQYHEARRSKKPHGRPRSGFELDNERTALFFYWVEEVQSA